MAKFIDMAGKRFGKLLVLNREGVSKNKKTLWKCLCDCGRMTITTGENLRNGQTKSCGCLHQSFLKNAHGQIKHGESFTRLYRIWAGMKDRCSNSHSYYYVRYGGRGITVCDEWKHSYESFRDWAMSNGYRDDLTIDRIDNDGNYCPENCRWATMTEQTNNRRCSRVYKGKSLGEWADSLGIKRRTLAARLERGWSWEDAVSIPYKSVRNYKDHCQESYLSEVERRQLPPEMRQNDGDESTA